MKKILAALLVVVLLSSFSFAYSSDSSAEASNSAPASPLLVSARPIPVSTSAETVVAVPTSSVSSSETTQASCIDETLNNDLRNLYELLKDAENSGNSEQSSILKSRIENLSTEIREKKLNCMNVVAQAHPVEVCIDSGLSAELTRLTLELSEEERIGNNETVSAIMAKKEEVMRLMKESREQCLVAQPVSSEVSSPSLGPAMQVITACNNLDDYRSKIIYLEKIVSDPESFGASQEKVEAIKSELNVLREDMGRYNAECNETVKANLGSMVSKAVKENESGTRDIVAYYKARLSQVISSDSNSTTQIEQLKQLRNEIDSLIRELLENQERISMQDIGEIVSVIKVTPGRIEADNVEVSTNSNKLIVNVNNELAEIVSNSTSVSLDSDGISADAEGLNVENGTLKVGESEIYILPSQIIGIINAVPKKMEIIEENSSAVYNIKADEDRRLLGVFGIKVEKQIKVNGNSGNIISQEMPWWAFLTTSAS